MTRQQVQLTGLEPSTPESPSYYSVQIRGIDAQGNPGPWSEWHTFQTTFQLDPELNDVIPGEPNPGDAVIYDGVDWTFGLVDGNSIASNSITSTQISENAISTPMLQAGAVVAGKIGANAVLANNIAANAVTADKIEANAVTVNKIAAGSVGSIQIADTLQSDNYNNGSNVAARDGWRITKSGEAIFNNIQIRGSGTIEGNLSINGSLIANGTVSAPSLVNTIFANTSTTNRLFGSNVFNSAILNSIYSSGSFNGTVISSAFADSAIGGTKISSISADKISGGTITGTTFRTSPNTVRIQINSQGSTIQFFHPSGTSQIVGGTTSNLLRLTSPGNVEITASGTSSNVFIVRRNMTGVGATFSGFLTTNGNLRADGTIRGESSLTASGTITFPNAYSRVISARSVQVNSTGVLGTISSSIRYKENIKSLNKNLYDNVKKLRAVTFDWKETKESDIGLIAEEVESVIPEIVSYDYYNENGDIITDLSMGYAKKIPAAVLYERIPVLILPILQEHDTIIQKLSDRIKELEDKLGEKE